MKVGRVIRLLFVIKSFFRGEAHPLINVVPIELTTLSLCKLSGKGRGCSPWNGIVKKNNRFNQRKKSSSSTSAGILHDPHDF